jgi:hypothetical protein
LATEVAQGPFFDEATGAATLKRRQHITANKLLPEDRAAHDWYRFVLSYPPHLVRDYVQRFGLHGNQLLLDPFCGTGTTIVEAKKLGIPSVGVEASPMAAFASRVKVSWTPAPAGLMHHASLVADMTRQVLNAEGIHDDSPLRLPLDASIPLKGLPPEKEKLILNSSISPLPLHKVLTLLDCLERNRDARYYEHERLALAKVIVFSVSNLNFGPEVGVGVAKQDAAVVRAWLEEVRVMSEDLTQLQKLTETPAVIHHSDSRQLLQVLEPGTIDAVITSPPYPNEKDYTRTTRLESVLLGFIQTKEDIRAVKRSLVRSNTRSVYKTDDDDQWVSQFPEIQQLAEEIEARRIALGKTSGFERLYGRVTKLYFGGMARHLAELRSVLRPGAQLAYVVGDQASYLRIMIRTGQLLGRIATSLGYDLSGIDLFRTRLATATKEQLREEVVVLRWPG